VESTHSDDVLTAIYIQNPAIVVREETEDGIMLFNPENGNVKVLNTTGRIIWNLYDGKLCLYDIVNHINDSFIIPKGKKIITDVLSFTNTMVDENYICLSTINSDIKDTV